MVAGLDAWEYARSGQFRLRDAEKLVGLSTRQILHAGSAKLKFPDWHTGKGNPRLLTIVELFQLRLLSVVDQRVPIPAIQHLADLGKGYLGLAFTRADVRSKPAVVLGYPDSRAAWWWLLGIDGKWPDSPPPQGTEVLVVIRIREVLGRLMQAVVEHLMEQLDEAAPVVPPEAFASSVAADLAHASTVPPQAGA